MCGCDGKKEKSCECEAGNGGCKDGNCQGKKEDQKRVLEKE